MPEVLGISLGAKTTLDNKLFVASTARPFGTLSQFVSEGDSTDNPVAVGGGQKMIMSHHIGDDTKQSFYVDFNTMENKTYLHEGYIVWQGADTDCVTMESVPKVTPYVDSSNTFFDLYGGYLIVPAPATGSIQILEDQNLVESPVSLDTGAREPAFWNANYDAETHRFSNLCAAPAMDGTYNMFGAEVNLARFCRILLVGTGSMHLATSDVLQIPAGMRIKMTIETDSSADHEWKATGIVGLAREISV